MTTKKTNMYFSHPERQMVYDLVISHVGNPQMKKTRVDNDYSLYMVEVASMLLNEKRFFIALVLNDSRPVGTMDYLSNIKWSSFQARTLQEAHPLDMPVHNYVVSRGLASSVVIVVLSRDKSVTNYAADKCPGIVVSLLHTKNQEYEYPNEGNIASALETYQTIIQFK